MDLSEEAKQAMTVISEAKDLVFYIYDTGFYNLERLQGAGAGSGLVKPVNFLLCHPPCHVRSQKQLENTNHGVFEPIDMENFCNRKMVRTDGRGYVFGSVLQFPPDGEDRSF